MNLQEHIPIGTKTTMRIGGTARYFAELLTRDDVKAAARFAEEKKIPLIVLGGGSNTVFADGEIEALVVRIKAQAATAAADRMTVQTGKILASLINECADLGLDLSPLTGIPRTLGGAIFGNAGQGPKGIWMDSFVVDVTAYVDGEWRTFTKEECGFGYRESTFKKWSFSPTPLPSPLPRGEGNVFPVIWEVTLQIPFGDPPAIKAEVERLIQKRIATQPHLRTAGSCFKAIGDKPAWQLIDAAGLRGHRIGGIQIAEKHANFLLNVDKGTFDDAKRIVETVKAKVTAPLDVEMRFV